MKRLILFFLLILPVSLSYAQDVTQASFNSLHVLAKAKLDSREYEEAKRAYDQIYALFKDNAAIIEEIGPEYSKCLAGINEAAAKAKASERVVLSRSLLAFPTAGGSDTVTVSAGINGSGRWIIESAPEWCKATEDGNTLAIEAPANPAPTFRIGDVVLSFKVGKKTISRNVVVSQLARPLQQRSVRIITSPEGAQVVVGSDPTPRISPVNITLPEGDISIHIVGRDYETLDTHIEVKYSDDPKATEEHRFVLTPKFGQFRFSLNAKGGKLDDKNPRVKIGNHSINMDPYYGRSNPRTFAADEKIVKYELYSDDNRNFIIPVDEDEEFTVTVSADSFNEYTGIYKASAGVVTPMDIVMNPMEGRILFRNIDNAEGAIIKDGSTPIGVMGQYSTEVSLTEEEHKISFEKEHFRTEQPVFVVTPVASETKLIDIRMNPMAYLSVSSVPEGAEIFIDSVSTGEFTPMYDYPVVVGNHTVSLTRSGFFPISIEEPMLSVGAKEKVHLEMKSSHPLIITTDRNDKLVPGCVYYIYLKEKNATALPIKVGPVLSSETLNIPYGEYDLELRRYSSDSEPGTTNGKPLGPSYKPDDLAYKGTFTFNEKTKGKLWRMTFSSNRGHAALHGNKYLDNSLLDVAATSNYSGMKRIADVGLVKFWLGNGFSTSILSATAYMNPDRKLLMKGSIMFLNGEFRAGGAASQFADAAVLLSYNYTPPIHGLLKELSSAGLHFEYMSGYDIFIGAELSSRIPVFNANLRFGYRIAGGPIYFYDSGSKGWASEPWADNAFVVSLGFTLGNNNSKGANILRLWY